MFGPQRWMLLSLFSISVRLNQIFSPGLTFSLFLAVISEQESSSHVSGLLSVLSPSHAPKTRSQTRKRKRSQSPIPIKPTFQTTPLTSLFIEGMSDDQVWEQLDIRTNNICQMLDLILGGQPEVDELESSMEISRHGLGGLEDKEYLDLSDLQDGMDSDSDSDSFKQSDEEEGQEETETGSESGDTESIAAEDVVGLHGSSSSEDSNEDETPSSLVNVAIKHSTTLPKKRGQRSQSQLDDGFFNLASFNAETERAEAKTSSSGHLGGDGDSDSDDIPVDLFAPLDQAEHSHDKDNIEEGGRHFSPCRKHPTDSS